jgi:hypothetical protein
MYNYVRSVSFEKYQGTSKLAENVVEQVLIAEGYTKRDFAKDAKANGYKNKTAYFEAIELGNELIEVGIYYSQPLGSQMSPDFIASTPNKIDFIEVKASRTTNGQTFNGHLIRPHFTYVLSDPSIDFIVKKGEDLMSPKVRKRLKEIDEQLRDIVEEGKKDLLNLGCNPQGWRYYVRAMYTQKRIHGYEPGPILHQTESSERVPRHSERLSM